ncbi:alpha-glucosidase [Allocatelliglobosispora scoriae]|uniref:Alpha-glucosidase n=1 Tax=Allocatelliglobosispora scoriae TaxID=643052 RepID=A0A841BWB5_9ACTN|nr:glycoside hydrolase family 13 protein [Allocatelliglobosispora scoriae]MBB5871768.1 alpha-glucosidase [Allocatelliglobosispora scoriae]
MTTADWRPSAAIYQVYPRSFADGNGDGIGDLAGVRKRLSYLAGLGIDAIWFSPWYPSPMADAGYDVADYCDIEPLFGTLAEAEQLIAEAHDLGLRIIIDIVPNHCSDQHPWFHDALATAPGSPERARFHFREGRGENGEIPPNNWQSHFGGPAWTQAGSEWYLHMFAPAQPDWNWDNPEVRAEFERILRFWLDRGVDGFRIDVADHLVKVPGLPDTAEGSPSPFSDLDGVHEIYRSWRRIMDEYPGERIFVAEAWIADPERFARYLRGDELHSAFNFPFLGAAWNAGALRKVIDDTLASHLLVEASPTWVLSNHDVTRPVTRYGRAKTSYWHDPRVGQISDLELGTLRSRAAALLSTSLPGGVYVYQGEELGLWEVEEIPDELRQDPTFFQTNGADKGRDGCRVPLPWSGTESPFGFNSTGTAPWLPQPAGWAALTAEVEQDDPDSMLSLYQRALRLRRSFSSAPFAWLPGLPDQVLAFRRGDIGVVVNFSPEPVELPAHAEIVLSSSPIEDGKIPGDTTAWLRLA